MGNQAGLIYGNDEGHIDHLGPYCFLKQIPLYVTSPTIYKALSEQYTNIEAYLVHPNAVSKILIEGFDELITTLPKALLEPVLFLDEVLLQKKLNTSWLPHGASDKKNLEVLKTEQHLLIYGNKMEDDLPEEARSKCTKVGNFRLSYFESNKEFYKDLLSTHFKGLSETENILYAPSWEDPNIDKWTRSLIEHKPPGMHLYIKLHPNTYKKGFALALKESYLQTPEVTFIDNFFPIYPILDHISYLFTDISSIGYDFLSFDRPLFFTTKKNNPLHQCGESVPITSPYSHLKKDSYKEKRKSLFDYTFKQKETVM